MKKISKKTDLGGRELSLEVGRFAAQANGAVLARYGDTVVLATVVSAGPKEELDYFPLFVEYQEKLYAGGKIKGSRWVKREGRPSDEAILAARLIDRSIRPLFPKDYLNEVQVIVTVLSVDGENDPVILSMVTASAALAISDIPWEGPIGAVRVGLRDDTFFVNPVAAEMEFSDLDLVVSGTEKNVVMVEAGARQVPEEKMLAAFEFGQENLQKIISLIGLLQKEVGTKKQKYEPRVLDEKLVADLEKKAKKDIAELVARSAAKKATEADYDQVIEVFEEEFEEQPKAAVRAAVEKVFRQQIRTDILKGKRPDGRKADQIRPIEVEVGVLPRTHGSAVFKRGETQVLTITTLGSPSLEQLIESMVGEETKRYMHHYYMPPFSVGETGRLGWPSRREVGHGALAERALVPVVPTEESFPYTIRVVSEILSSNGSTSMASVCGSTLSLMDAGVPIAAPIAGLALGLVTDSKKEIILSDIIGLEDFNGDMDFKVAGSKQGISAIQLDVKIPGISHQTLKKALEQAREGRMFILEEMLKVLPEARTQLSQYAPKIKVIRLDPEKIGDVIGPGGRTIRKIIAETGAAIDVEDDGTVSVTAPDEAGLKAALDWISGLTREVKEGEVFEGTVKRIQPFGAFVEVLPGKEGLVHVSQMSADYVESPEKVVEVGQKVKVRVREIDDLGRINLSMRFGKEAEEERPRRPEGRRPQPSGRGRPHDRRPDYRSDSRRGSSGRRPSGHLGGMRRLHSPRTRYERHR